MITGTLPSLSRQAATDMIVRYGGKVVASVSSKTDYLLVGKDPGSKIEKALKLKIAQVSEEELRGMVGE